VNPLTILVSLGFIVIVAVVAYLVYRRILRRAKSIERGLKMVPIRIHIPPFDDKVEAGLRDPREAMRRKIAPAETLYSIIAGSTLKGFKSKFYGQRHVSFEMVATDGTIHFYVAVPVALVPVLEQAVQSAYPTARLEEVEDYNPFSEQGKLPGTLGGELILKEKFSQPLMTYNELETDPIDALVNTLSTLKPGEGAAIQMLIRPAGKDWVKKSIRMVRQRRRYPGYSSDLSFDAKDMLRATTKSPKQRLKEHPQTLTGTEEAAITAIEEKAKHPGFETLVRIVVSTNSHERSQAVLTQMATAFALLESPGHNGLKLIMASNIEGLVTAFIFRFFPPELKIMILNTVELATIFHLPDARPTTTAQVERQQFHEVDGPVNLPSQGLLFGFNSFRGVQKEVRLDTVDRRRHTYVVGQTGTGKSTLLENLAVQDMLNGDGFAFIDPHGDTAEKILSMVPKNRAEDVIYFNPGDTTRPLGLNLFEFTDPTQKDFLVQESLSMLYKLYDPGKTGIIGPRFEQWYRNAALTLMSDPAGSTFIEIPKVFTDNDYLKQKFKYVNDQTVVDFWTKEMAQTSDYHKSEMLGWFVSKFGAFLSNEIMRNIIGQTKSSFDLRDIMDNKKILIVNLSKGLIGELNSQLLGMIFVIKFQAAAMSRANVPEDQRNDFCLYVDEFQNFSTDSFATILSEARKYRLNLTVANQFIGQLSEDVKNAVFGNVGTIVSFRTGPEDAEFLVKQFQPVFDAHDLVNIPNGRAILRLMVGGLPSQPFSINALPPLQTHSAEMGEAVKQLSAAKFGTTKAAVEADINARLTTQPLPAPPQPKPIVAVEQPVASTPAAASDQAVPPDDRLTITPQVPAAAPIAQAPPPVAPEPAPASQPVVSQPAPTVPAPAALVSSPVSAMPAPNAAQPAPQFVSDPKPVPPPQPPKPVAPPVEAALPTIQPQHRKRIPSPPSSQSEQTQSTSQASNPRQDSGRRSSIQPSQRKPERPPQTAPVSLPAQPTPQPAARNPTPAPKPAAPRPQAAPPASATPVITSPTVVQPQPQPVATIAATPSTSAQPASTTPKLKHGEVHVDEHGNVTMG